MNRVVSDCESRDKRAVYDGTTIVEMWESESVHEAAAFRAVGHSLSVSTCFPRSHQTRSSSVLCFKKQLNIRQSLFLMAE